MLSFGYRFDIVTEISKTPRKVTALDLVCYFRERTLWLTTRKFMTCGQTRQFIHLLEHPSWAYFKAPTPKFGAYTVGVSVYPSVCHRFLVGYRLNERSWRVDVRFGSFGPIRHQKLAEFGENAQSYDFSMLNVYSKYLRVLDVINFETPFQNR